MNNDLCLDQLSCACMICGKSFNVRSSYEKARRKTCSYSCATRLRWPQKPSRECVVCAELFIPKQKEHLCCSRKCATKKMQATHIANGHRPLYAFVEERRLAALRTPEHRKKISEIHTGRVHSTPQSKRESALHSRAAVFFVKSPANIIYLVMNITKFVTEHENLFPPETVVWKWKGKSKSCRATIGLHTIHKGHRGVWRGWMKVSDIEAKQNLDLVPRTFVDPNN